MKNTLRRLGFWLISLDFLDLADFSRILMHFMSGRLLVDFIGYPWKIRWVGEDFGRIHWIPMKNTLSRWGFWLISLHIHILVGRGAARSLDSLFGIQWIINARAYWISCPCLGFDLGFDRVHGTSGFCPNAWHFFQVIFNFCAWLCQYVARQQLLQVPPPIFFQSCDFLNFTKFS